LIAKKFKIQSLDQQLQLTKQENDRNSAELDAKIEEFAKYRREAHSQRATLQSAFDALSHEHESCKAELESLKQVHENQQHQLNTALEKVNSLQDQLADEGAAARAQADTQARLIELLERRNADAKKRVQDLDNEWDRMVQEHNEREEMLKEQLRRERERGDRLDVNLTRFIESSDGPTLRGASSSSPEPTPGASIVSSFMKGTKVSDIFDENIRVKAELQKVKMENVRLTDTTTQLISKVQEMVSQTKISCDTS
jgi:nucleoprotein TPR